ncbi:(Uracil-5)-methyltransferase domain-containing protein [Rozella allomycis CSF55]|uniref:(Uracil-5)-methyltransferase domain-containing protein n=1 Tax=Rozella allomycis (strain CSF55) TaxID=988480 RepID=A0A075AVP8_ROZAC|nr:(Uracil-5)-methyltransferase domain-containing protein [Rozella allomycis CSF55]|eukprot:EPZ34345.1 (Uracil-5)-methyltransferase domain-containing protein [Rozella allomycis CSF55]
MSLASKLVIVMRKVSMRSNEKKIKTFVRQFAQFEDQEDKDEEFIRTLADKLDGKKFGEKIINVIVDENTTHFNRDKTRNINKNITVPDSISERVCPLVNVPYEQQLKLKQEKAQKVMKDVETKSKTLDGSFGKSVTMFPDEKCLHLPAYSIPLLTIVQVKCISDLNKKYVQESEHQVYDEQIHSGVWRLLMVRHSSDVLVAFQIHPQNLSEDLSKSLSNVFDNNPNCQEELIYGQDFVTEKLFDLSFQISRASFFQVNTKGAETLYSEICNQCEVDENTIILDLCCGTGTIGQVISSKVKKVIGVELVYEAVEDAKKNAKINEFICSKVEDAIGNILSGLDPTERVVAILDPPRAGIPSFIKHIVYASCKPELAMNNFIQLTDQTGNFKVTNVVPVDMFPHTEHYELLLTFKRE